MVQRHDNKNSKTLFLLSIILIGVVIIFSLMLDSFSRRLLASTLLPILFLSPLLIIIKTKKLFLHLIYSISFLFLLVGLLGVGLRLIKNILLQPKVGEMRAIGYDHYFNYPLNFDAIVIYIFLLFPFLVVIASWFLLRKKYDN